MACGGPGGVNPTLPSYSVRCHDHCMLKELHGPDFNISVESIGDRRQQTITVERGGTVQDYCLSYGCSSRDAWEMIAWACVCFSESAIAEADQKIDSDFAR